ncbi:ABC transporter ATP-binding protein [Hansschlegelia quercus]|uniref:ABC transporter ATP-binding protein n=1 Tax=Hansschlegelia quercus TaxID=2528245 RepID=A0A4Q9GHG1_9HYPH|nr:ABC transporter ATP-binding protein [Hansschlegelia quercus]TBN53482.1 ABC transporter ATP-binding protein [Hansschlegelia quercus]
MTDAPAASPQPLLSVQALEGWYGESHVLHGMTFDVASGEVVSLLGRNGAGKTTTLRAIIGVLGKRRGSVTCAGVETIGMPARSIARLGVGYVPEERGIFAGLSVQENLTLPPKLRPGGMDLEQIYRLFPNLKERARSPGTKLSGGEQQMLAIARILRTGSKLILLDEPTEGLAPVIVERIAEVIQRLKADGYTIILVEQNLRFAQSIAGRFVVVEQGRVVDAISNESGCRLHQLHAYLGV